MPEPSILAINLFFFSPQFHVITNNPAPGIIQFKNETLLFKIAVHPITMQVSVKLEVLLFYKLNPLLC